MHPGRKEIHEKSKNKGGGAVISLKEFDFITDPQGTLRSLKKIIAADCSVEKVHIDFKDYYCWDIASYMVLMLILDESQASQLSGTYSMALKKVLEATRLAKMLDPVEGKETEYKGVWALPVSSCKGGSSHIEAPHAKLAQKTADNINVWLHMRPFEVEDFSKTRPSKN